MEEEVSNPDGSAASVAECHLCPREVFLGRKCDICNGGLCVFHFHPQRRIGCEGCKKIGCYQCVGMCDFGSYLYTIPLCTRCEDDFSRDVLKLFNAKFDNNFSIDEDVDEGLADSFDTMKLDVVPDFKASGPV